MFLSVSANTERLHGFAASAEKDLTGLQQTDRCIR